MDAVGGGCTCIMREVMQAVQYQYMSETVGAEDFQFCLDAKAMGFEVWYDSTIMATHFTTVPI